MKVARVTKLKEKYTQYDISTETENFYVKSGNSWVLVHNSPAIFAGKDPSDGKFFVAKKGVFAKNPKVYKTEADIDADTSGDLASKLKKALKYLPSLGIQGIIQGDFMYSKEDLKTIDYDGERYITFHPNTIVYAVPEDSKLAKQIKRSEIGIVWHTLYTGDSLESMSATFAVPIAQKLKNSSKVWSVDAVFRDVSGKASLTKAENKKITSILSNAGKLFGQLDRKTLNGISENEELLLRTKVFFNTKVRAGKPIGNTSKFTNELVQYLMDYFSTEEGKRKSEKGKSTVRQRKSKTMEFFAKVDKKKIKVIFDIMNELIVAKMMIINKMDQASTINTLLRTKDGYKVTNPEGYVAVDHPTSNAVKLVDRLQFSHANFNDEVQKGWQK